jgi:DNA polymerase-3 subunit beta
MYVTVTQESFAKALSYVAKAISSNPSIPVLANVLIETTKDQLKLSTTDLELGINTLLGADVKKEGKVTADARTLAEFVNSLADGKLTLELKDNILEVKNKTNSADFNVINAEEFPPLPKVTTKAGFKVNGASFAKAIEQVVFSVASDDSRPVLTGILFEGTAKKLVMVGVDGFRLSRKSQAMKRSGSKEFSHIVPGRALQELARICLDLCEEDDMVEVHLLGEKNQMIFKVKDVELSTRLIEGEFPDYKQIIPKEAKVKFAVDKESFGKTIKIVSIFARSAVGNKSVFEFIPEKNTLKLSAQVADVGENESSVEVHDTEGDNLKTAFNTRFLSDMITAIDGEEVSFESNGVTAPGVFRDKDDKDFLHIIMPMRID